MITSRAWSGKRYAVFGLARSGVAAARALVAAGASVVAWDEDEARREMKEMIQRLPDPQRTWDAFLAKDEFIHRTIVEECQACGIQLFWRDENTAPAELAQAVGRFLGL